MKARIDQLFDIVLLASIAVVTSFALFSELDHPVQNAAQARVQMVASTNQNHGVA